MRIALAGLGTVGAEMFRLVQVDAELHTSRADGAAFRVVAVSARDLDKDRKLDLRGVKKYKDAVKMARARNVDVVVELIGGDPDGVALRVVQAAIAAGKHVVTANKALLAKHGMELARAAEQRGVTLAFEAAVAGGIPIIEILRQALTPDRLSEVGGILNGTCNYILWRMTTTGCTFEQALAEAQQKGYAEADPSRDIDGKDTADKLAILAAMAFGVPVDLANVYVEGIRHVTALDIQKATQIGMVVKLLGLARLTPQGLECRVHPCLVPTQLSLAKIDRAINAVTVVSNLRGRGVYQGAGAGARPTAAAVVTDLIDLATGRRIPAFGKPVSELRAIPYRPMSERVGRFYLRLQIVDEPRVLGDVLTLLGMQGVSLSPQDHLPDQQVGPDGSVSVFLATHPTSEAAMQSALTMIRELKTTIKGGNTVKTIKGEPCLIRIEEEV